MMISNELVMVAILTNYVRVELVTVTKGAVTIWDYDELRASRDSEMR